MHFNLTDEQAMVRASAERLVKQHCSLERRRERIGRGEGVDAQVWSQMVELGWLALCIPEDEGGLGGTMTDVALLMIELGRGMCPAPIVSSAVLSARLLADSGWDERASWIERAVFHGSRLAFAHLERGERMETLSPRRTIINSVDGVRRLTGAKFFVLDGEGAEAFLVTAITTDTAEFVIALIPNNRPGLSVQTYTLIDGTRATDLVLDNVALIEGDIVARGHVAARLFNDALARATVADLACAVGSMEACLDICSEYLKIRSQFGQPIGKFQALQHLMADMLVEAHNARSGLYCALANFDADHESRQAAISAAKVLIGQAGLSVSRVGIQLHGGYGLTDEFAIGHHHRFLSRLEKCYGDTHAHVWMLADRMLGADDELVGGLSGVSPSDDAYSDNQGLVL